MECKEGFSIDDAIVLAAQAHYGQRDKGRPNLPYVTHPLRVMAASTIRCCKLWPFCMTSWRTLATVLIPSPSPTYGRQVRLSA